MGKLTAEDLEFIAEARAAAINRAPTTGRRFMWIVVFFLVAAVAWANFAKLDEVTRGDGKVIPSRQVQVIQNLEGGILSEIRVREGEVVDEGQVLLRIDDTRFQASYRESQSRINSLRAKIVRLTAESEGSDFTASIVGANPEYLSLIRREQELYENHKRELDATLEIYRKQAAQRSQELVELRSKQVSLERGYELIQKELELTRPLIAEGAVSEVEILRLERTANDVDTELVATKLAIPRVRATIDEANKKLEEVELSFRNDAREELNDLQSELTSLIESSVALEDRVSRTYVRSPVHGTIKQLLINTVGGVIQPGMDIIEIVPLEDTLLVEVRVRPADIGFLHPEMDAVVKISAYDFAVYGGLDAKVEHISPDSILDEQGESYYLVKVRTDKNFLGPEENPLSIIPGMQASVDILTGKKTVLDYLLQPVTRARDRALRER